jgi:hypothetical protein
LFELTPEALIKTHIQKARFIDVTMNELAQQEKFSQKDVLKQIEILSANAEQSPWDAVKAAQLLEFIDNKLPHILNPSNSRDEDEEERNDRHSSKMQHGGEAHLDLRALGRIEQ